MNAQPRNKMLVLIIAILLIANIVTLSFFLLTKTSNTKTVRLDKRAQLAAFLKKDVGFSADQLTQYDSISSKYRTRTRTLFDEMTASRKIIFRQVANEDFSDSAIDIAAKEAAAHQKSFEVKMLLYIKDVRNICTPVQRAVFDSGFYKIIAKKGERSKNEEKQ